MLEVASSLLVFVVPPALALGLGRLLGSAIAPARYAPLRPWVDPAIGIAFVASVGPLAGALGVSLRTIAWPLALLASVGLVLLARDGRTCRWWRSHALVLLVGVGAFLLAVAPLAAQGFLTTVGTSIDAISYNVRSEFVQEHALSVPAVTAGRPWLAWVAAQIALIRVGDVYFLGFVSFVLSRRSFEVLSAVCAVAHAYSALGTYFFVRVGLRGARRVAVVAASLVALNGTLIWPGLDCGFSQALSLSLIPVCLGVAAFLLRRPSIRGALVLGVLLSALVSVYPVYAAVVGAAVGLAGISSMVLSARPGERRVMAVALLATGAVSLAASPVGSLRAVRELGFVGGILGERGVAAVGAGNILVFPPAGELFGFISHAAAAHGLGQPGHSSLLAGPFAVLAALFVSRGALLTLRLRASVPLAFLGAAGALALHQRFLLRLPGGYPYGYFKAVTLLALVLAPLLAAGLLDRLPARRLRPWATALTGGFLLLAGGCALWTVRYSASSQVVASRELVEAARQAELASRGRPVEILVEAGPRQNWLGYLLRDEMVTFPGGNAIHPATMPLLTSAPALAVMDLQRTNDADVAFALSRPSRLLWGGSRFRLVEWTDRRLAEWPVTGVESLERGTVRATLDRAGGSVRFDLGKGAMVGRLPSVEPRTLQLSVSVPDGATLLVGGDEVPIARGTWLIDWDVTCRGPLEATVSRGLVVPGSFILVGEPTGESGRCFEVLSNPRGRLAWSGTLKGDILRGELELTPPGGAPPESYRVGLHIGGGSASRSGWWGVFSLDFPPDGLPHRATIRIDLRARTGSGSIDGAPAPVEEVAKEVGEGRFSATLALWKTQPSGVQLLTVDIGSFEVAPGGEVVRGASAPRFARWWNLP